LRRLGTTQLLASSRVAEVFVTASILGGVEAIWVLTKTVSISAVESLSVLALAAIAYAVPALPLCLVWVATRRGLGQFGARLPQIPGTMIAAWLWLVVFVAFSLEGSRLLRIFTVALLGIGLAALFLLLGNRISLKTRPAVVWALLLEGFWIVSGFCVVVWHTSGARKPTLLAVLMLAAFCCLWGFARPLGRRWAAMASGVLVISAISGTVSWPFHGDRYQRLAGSRPNVILVTIDALRADHLGAYGYAGGETANLDKIAQEGAVFSEAFSSAVITCPSHISILTGLDPLQHGVTTNQPTPIRGEIPTVADTLRRDGYETAAFVSGWTLKRVACDIGGRFDTYSDDFSPVTWMPEVSTRIRMLEAFAQALGHFGFRFGRLERQARETTDAVIQWLKRRHERPFLLWIHYFDTHIPYAAPPPYETKLDPSYKGIVDGTWYDLSYEEKERIATHPRDVRHMIARYDGEIAYVDSQVGRLYAALEALDLLEKTLIVVTADHGESQGEHNNYFGRDLYRPSLHVPLLIRFPDNSFSGSRVTRQVRLIDVAPTICAYTGIQASSRFTGRSLLPLLQGRDTAEPRPLFAVADSNDSNHGDTFAIQSGGNKLIWKAAWWSNEGERIAPAEEFYDLRSDPLETTDLTDSQSPSRAKLREQWTRWRQRLQAKPPIELDKRHLRNLRTLGYIQ